LARYCPGVSQVRNVFRFAIFVQMAAVLLSAQAISSLAFLARRCRFSAGRVSSPVAQPPWKGRLPISARLFVLALGVAAILEVLPYPIRLGTAPDAMAHAGWLVFIREQTPPGRSVACLPFAQGNTVEHFEATARWMYLSTFHGVPMVDGYSGFFPDDYFPFRDAVNQSFPADPILDELARRDVEFVVVDRHEVPAALLGAIRSTERLQRVLQDPVGIDVYRLRPRRGQ
jgi:hypothetical protein